MVVKCGGWMREVRMRKVMVVMVKGDDGEDKDDSEM